MVRTMGLNVLIAFMYFNQGAFGKFVTQRPFVATVFCVFLDNVLVFYSMQQLGKYLRKARPSNGSLAQRFLASEPSVEDAYAIASRYYDAGEFYDADSPCTADNIYMDLNCRLGKVVAIFFVQVLLCCLFQENMNDDKDAGNLELKHVKWMYWLGGVMIQMFAADEQLGKEYQGQFWNHVFTDKQYTVMHNEAVYQFSFIDRTHLTEFKIRWFMDFFVNSICRLVVLYAFPIMLCVEEPLDFVKDCTAVFFMTTLDDIAGDGFSHAAILARLKFRLFLCADED
jgi:hypothetical protein